MIVSVLASAVCTNVSPSLSKTPPGAKTPRKPGNAKTSTA